jgi:hypothetical protein
MKAHADELYQQAEKGDDPGGSQNPDKNLDQFRTHAGGGKGVPELARENG